MRDTGNRDLRKLARDYYRGELSYVLYRRARTQLLDRVTAVTNDADCTMSTTRQVIKPARASQSLDKKSERSWYLRGAVWVLVVALITVILMVWAMKSGWITLSLDQPDPADTAVSAPSQSGLE